MRYESLIIDKSALQSLSRDEAAHLTLEYEVNTVPVLLAEILGDVAKATATGRTSDAQLLASKFGGSGNPPNVDFRQVCYASLVGQPIPMTGQMLASGGIEGADTGHGRGILFGITPQQEALMRWASGQFSAEDLAAARRWRATVRGFDLAKFDRHIRSRNVEIPRPTSDEHLRCIVSDVLAHQKPQEPWLLFLLEALHSPADARLAVRRRWNALSPTTMEAFAPYAHFCLVALLYVLVLWKHKLTKHEPANLVDVQYLYYLPFCHVFCSRDKLHQRVAPLLFREDQRFVWGDDMKREMRKLAQAKPFHRRGGAA